MFRFASAPVTVTLVAALAGCASSHSNGSELEVDAEIAAISLAEDCGGVARPAEPGAGAPPAGDCAEDSCPSFCQQSNLTLRMTVGEGEGPVDAVLLSVRLLDYDSDEHLADLTARQPRIWVGEDGYVSWDELLGAPSDERTLYDLSTPDWNRIGDGDSWATFSMRFRVEVTLEIDGHTLTLLSDEITREPLIVT